MRRFRGIGPGAVITAAFIGPGTVTTATLAGARFGYTLLWTLTFATLATIALQEMSARLGVVAHTGLGEALRLRLRGIPRAVGATLVVSAIVIGNGAYETGNLLGAGLGVAGLSGVQSSLFAPGVGVLAFALLWTGSYRLLERLLVALVALMGVVFVGTAIAIAASWDALAIGAVRPALPGESEHIALALVGTTIVPYNLFLHASAARQRWEGASDLFAARLDTVVSVALGGAISGAILVTAAGLPAGVSIESAAQMAGALEPTLGAWARSFFSLGLFAAGLTSAITAPMAAAYATAGAFGWGSDLRSVRVRAVWGLVVLVGTAAALAGPAPVPAIVFAQATNGLLLPLIVAFLLWAVNDRAVLGRYANGWLANLVGLFVLAVALVLGARAVWQALLP